MTEPITITTVEGLPLSRPALVRELAGGANVSLIEVTMPAGAGSPPHEHDHESAIYVVSGEVEVVQDGERHLLRAGDGFLQPPHAVHSMTAIGRDAVWLEVKSPPAVTW